MAANIAAIYIESFLYGLFFILSLTSIYLILKYDGDRSTTSPRPTILGRPMLLGTVLLFLIITIVSTMISVTSTCEGLTGTCTAFYINICAILPSLHLLPRRFRTSGIL